MWVPNIKVNLGKIAWDGMLKCWKFVELRHNWRHLEKGSAPWSLLVMGCSN
jgi:hypothetical protein